LKEVTHLDTIYDEETVHKISVLRHERWALLLTISMNSNLDKTILTEAWYTRYQKRLAEVNIMLYELTKNEIYNVR